MNIEEYTALKYGSLFNWHIPTLYTVREICEHYKIPYTAELEKKGISFQNFIAQKMKMLMIIDEAIQSNDLTIIETPEKESSFKKNDDFWENCKNNVLNGIKCPNEEQKIFLESIFNEEEFSGTGCGAKQVFQDKERIHNFKFTEGKIFLKEFTQNTKTEKLTMSQIIANKKKQPSYVSVAGHYKHK